MVTKIKGKEWYTIVAPKLFDNKVLGETPVDDPKKLKWRKIETSAINVTNDMNKYYFKIQFRINEVDGKQAKTVFSGLECLRDYISRMIRYGIERIDTVQNLVTKDNKKIIVKTIIITNKRVKKGIEVDLTKFVLETIKKTVEGNDLDDFLIKILDDSLKKYIIKNGSKIYPIRNFEIRKIEMPLEILAQSK